MPDGIVDPDALIATSCLAPSSRWQGRFRVVGAGGLQSLPNDLASSPFPTLAVPSAGTAVSNDLTNTGQDLNQLTVPPHGPIVEADGMYQLEDDSFVFGRICHLQ